MTGDQPQGGPTRPPCCSPAEGFGDNEGVRQAAPLSLLRSAARSDPDLPLFRQPTEGPGTAATRLSGSRFCVGVLRDEQAGSGHAPAAIRPSLCEHSTEDEPTSVETGAFFPAIPISRSKRHSHSWSLCPCVAGTSMIPSGKRRNRLAIGPRGQIYSDAAVVPAERDTTVNLRSTLEPASDQRGE